METLQTREKLTGQVIVPLQEYAEIEQAVKSVQDLAALLGTKEGDMTSLLAHLLAGSVLLDASDLHAETEKEGVKVRLRIDGMLQDALQLPSHLYESLLSRIKLVSQIKLNVADKPQDGRFSLEIEGRDPIEIRTATLPSEYGESVVLRILNPQNLAKLDDLGLRKDLTTLFQKEIRKPNGMIVVTGPTGSGKSTTLYAFLQEVKNPQVKVITIEDPIEYHLKDINQTQVNPAKGYDFASGLRAIVRQDPDVILVGEIRDGETSEIALQAALTGHLVFSTLHTNDAAGTISRLRALGSKPSTIASALSLVIAQRLVRKACQACKEMTAATPQEVKTIREAMKALKQPLPKTLQIPRAKGCKQCNMTGYKGRVGIFEAIAVDDKMEEFILSSDSISALKAFAKKQGMIPMFDDGIGKVVQGITTIQEVQRVTEE